MATRLKDFVSYYDVLEVPAECTKVRSGREREDKNQSILN